jgi:hypothetical protein
MIGHSEWRAQHQRATVGGGSRFQPQFSAFARDEERCAASKLRRIESRSFLKRDAGVFAENGTTFRFLDLSVERQKLDIGEADVAI